MHCMGFEELQMWEGDPIYLQSHSYLLSNELGHQTIGE